MATAQNLTPLQRPILSRTVDTKDRLITAHEAAIIAKRKEVTIYNAGNEKVGKLHPIRDNRGHVMFSEQEVRKVYGDSPVDRRKSQHDYQAPIINSNDPKDFNSVMMREADSLLAQISVMEATLSSLKKKYSLLEPLLTEIRK